ncbi:MAG: hypothetical protein U0894_00740 [Pirellulales bacterium]
MTTFNLDEYWGWDRLDPQSYRYFMQQQLFDHININPANTNVRMAGQPILKPTAKTMSSGSTCRMPEGLICRFWGIGSDGHIAF